MRYLPCILLLTCSRVNSQFDPNAVIASNAQDSGPPPPANPAMAPRPGPDSANGQLAGQGQSIGPASGPAMQTASNPQSRPPDGSAVGALGANALPVSDGADALKPEVRVQAPTPDPNMVTPEIKTPDLSPPTPEPGSLEASLTALIDSTATKLEVLKNTGAGTMEYKRVQDEFQTKLDNITKTEGDDRNKIQALAERILKDLELERMSNAIDCSDFYLSGVRSSGVYSIKPTTRKLPFDVYCDLEKDGGGWTLIQRRGDFGQPDDYFYKNWTEYKRGFGPLAGEFWLGNEQIKDLTSQGQYSLRINMYDYDNAYLWAEYLLFTVANQAEDYQLKISGFSSNLQFDSMAFHDLNKFSTYDRDNDKNIKGNCAADRKGGWWYNNCANANLNGVKSDNNENSTLTWYVEGKGHVPLSKVEMKIRPKAF